MFFGSQFRYAAAMFPVAGSAVVSLAGRFEKGQPRDDRFGASPITTTASAAIGAPVSTYKLVTTGKGEGRATRDVLTMLSLALPGFAGAVAGLAKRPAGYLADIHEGKVEPTGPVDFARGLITGRASPASKQ